MTSLGDMSPAIKEVATGFDTIGWVDVMHGRTPRALHRFQSTYCASVNSRMTGTDWMKTFVTKLLNISHAQWMYRNFSLHNKIKGYLKLTHQAAVITEIAELSNSRPEDIPEESKFLLEVEMFTLDSSSLTQQEYWIKAMTAALSAGRRSSRPWKRRCTQPTQPPHSQNRALAKQRRDVYRFKWRIRSILRQMQEDLDLSYGSWRSKRVRVTDDALTNGSNKRLRKPD